MSARVLGQQLARFKTASEVNLMLAAHGYLEGWPGAWQVTQKGLEFAREVTHSPGGWSWPYTVTTWDSTILAVLEKAPPVAVETVRAQAAAAKAAAETARAAVAAPAVASAAQSASRVPLTLTGAPGRDLKALGLMAGAVLATRAVQVGGPRVRAWWASRASQEAPTGSVSIDPADEQAADPDTGVGADPEPGTA